uniref:Glucuronosyltransferase n=1 Tax=Branchiostoma floridae TaxID=7739 RepID=C3YVT2_BRAFL|eukprot:XP_002599604.1 hypothetical protein BRAFLDRAFT_58543 [Branchiostoma floridae]
MDDGSKTSTVLLFFLGVLVRHITSGENVLLVPTPCAESHWFTLANIGQALVHRGHVVTVVVPEDIAEKRRAERPDFKFETFRDQGTFILLKEAENPYIDVTNVVTKHCALLFGDIDLMSRLKAAQHRLVVYDSCVPVGAILAAHKDVQVPSIAILRGDHYFLDIKATGVPIPLSYVPLLGIDLSDHMTFVQRVYNVVFYILLPVLGRWVASNTYDGLVSKYVGENETIQSVVSNTDLWLYQTDHVLDFPAPSMPNMVQIGGLHIVAASPLPKELEALFQSVGDDGVVVVSLGSIIKTMSSEKRQVFAAAFARLRQKVVWRYAGEKPAGLGSNTKLLDWLPQNDLLGTKQDFRKPTSRLSRLYRDQPQSPMERTVWWIEHVIKHDKLPHLRPRAVELPWYQYYLLDVAAFLLAVCAAVLGTVWYGCSLVCGKILCKNGGKLKSQ